jgi:acyl CoA:acetate/3-ketoacid CoA transferase alpha subunit
MTEEPRVTHSALGEKIITLQEAAARVPHGAHLTVSGFAHSLAPLALVRELIRQGKGNFELTSMGDCWAADMLAGAGRLKRARLSNYMFEGFGRCPNFSRAAEAGAVEVDDYSHFAITSRWFAAALGLPSMPVRVMLGTDLVRKKPLDRDAIAEAPCPLTGEPLLFVRASRPDFALLHASRADPEGNVQLFGTTSTIEEQARAAKRVIVTVEEIVPGEVIREQPEFTLLPAFLVEAVVDAPFGAHPAGMFRYYDYDHAHVAEYVRAGKSVETFRQYLEEYVFRLPDHYAYLNKIGIRRLMALRADPWRGY